MIQLKNFERISSGKSWVTIGTFDGVHVGHQKLIRGLVTKAHHMDAQAVVVTFYPHPAIFLGKREGNINLTTQEERADLIQALDVDFLVTQVFNHELASTSARDYVRRIKEATNMVTLYVGHDFALGKDRQGDLGTLKKLGIELDFEVEICEPVREAEEVVSSSLIRSQLWAGNVQGAAELLGRTFTLSGKVVHGDKRGSKIGIPTANLEVAPEKLVPARGVYACQVNYKGEKYPAATNIGFRPTFDGQEVSLHVETHILGFTGNLYGKTITLEFMQFLRGEMRFENVQALVDQIHLDIQQTRSIVPGQTQ